MSENQIYHIIEGEIKRSLSSIEGQNSLNRRINTLANELIQAIAKMNVCAEFEDKNL